MAFLAFPARADLTDCGLGHAINQGEPPRVFENLPFGKNAFGFSDRVHWIKVRCPKLPELVRWVLEVGYPHLDDIQLFDDNFKPLFHVGDLKPFAERPVGVATFALPLEAALLQRGVVLRVRSTSSLQIPLSLSSSEEFWARQLRSQSAQSLYFGLLLAMVVFNALLWLLIKERVIAFYIGYLVSFGLLQSTMNGWTLQYLFPQAPLLANKMLPATAWLVFGFMVLFFRSFLRTSENLRGADRVLVWTARACGALALASLVLPYGPAIRAAVLFSILFVPAAFALSLRIALKGYVPAYFFLAAWAMFLGGTLLLNLKNFGLLPSNLLTDHGAQFGSALEVLFLSLGIGFRIRLVESEKQRALSMAELSRKLAHDIRSPLSALQIAAASLPQRASAQRDLLDLATQRIFEISEDLLARSRDGNAPGSAVVADLRALLLELATESRAIAGRRAPGCRFALEVSRDALPAVVMPAQFKRALSNLINNAFDAVAGRPDGTVTLAAAHAGQNIQIIVSDNGCGISAANLETFKNKAVSFGKPGGSGIGLNSAREIITGSGGTMDLSSLEGRGTSVTITLPAVSGRFEPRENARRRKTSIPQ